MWILGRTGPWPPTGRIRPVEPRWCGSVVTGSGRWTGTASQEGNHRTTPGCPHLGRGLFTAWTQVGPQESAGCLAGLLDPAGELGDQHFIYIFVQIILGEDLVPLAVDAVSLGIQDIVIS